MFRKGPEKSVLHPDNEKFSGELYLGMGKMTLCVMQEQFDIGNSNLQCSHFMHFNANKDKEGLKCQDSIHNSAKQTFLLK